MINSPANPISVAIVEDDETVRESLVYLLGSRGFAVTGSYATAEGLLLHMALPEARPQVVLLDLELPGMHGLEAIGRLRAMPCAPEVVVLTIFDDRETLLTALKAGAGGYILKESPTSLISDALKEVLAGGAPMSPAIARSVLAEFQPRPSTEEDPDAFSTRERDVVEFLAQGFTYEQIGEKLFISTHTVNVHIKKIYRKLGVHSRAEAVNKLRNRGPADL